MSNVTMNDELDSNLDTRQNRNSNAILHLHLDVMSCNEQQSRERKPRNLTLEQVVVVLSVIVVIIGRGFSGVIGSEYWNCVGTCLPTAMSLSSASACCWLFSEAERAIFMFK